VRGAPTAAADLIVVYLVEDLDVLAGLRVLVACDLVLEALLRRAKGPASALELLGEAE